MITDTQQATNTIKAYEKGNITDKDFLRFWNCLQVNIFERVADAPVSETEIEDSKKTIAEQALDAIKLYEQGKLTDVEFLLIWNELQTTIYDQVTERQVSNEEKL